MESVLLPTIHPNPKGDFMKRNMDLVRELLFYIPLALYSAFVYLAGLFSQFFR